MRMCEDAMKKVLKDFLDEKEPWTCVMEYKDMEGKKSWNSMMELIEMEVKKKEGNEEELYTLKKYLIYKLYFMSSKCVYPKVEELSEKIKENYNGLQEADAGDLAKSIYEVLWNGKNEMMPNGSLNKICFSTCYGGDTMNSVQHILNSLVKHMLKTEEYPQVKKMRKKRQISIRFLCYLMVHLSECDQNFIKDLEDNNKLQAYIDQYHTLGNLVLVPKGFNTARASRAGDYWDFSLQLLKEEFSEKDKYITSERGFNYYINYFYLWDYVTGEEDGVYEVKNLFLNDVLKENYIKCLGKERISKDKLETFFKTTCEYIERRGQFMTILLRLKKAESEDKDMAEVCREFFKYIQGKRFLNKCHDNGYSVAIKKLRKLLKDSKVDKSSEIYKQIFSGIEWFKNDDINFFKR